MSFLPTIEYSAKDVAEREITMQEYHLSEAIGLISDYLQMDREAAVVHTLEKYDIGNIDSAVLQMMTYMYADAASELQDLGSGILGR